MVPANYVIRSKMCADKAHVFSLCPVWHYRAREIFGCMKFFTLPKPNWQTKIKSDMVSEFQFKN